MSPMEAQILSFMVGGGLIEKPEAERFQSLGQSPECLSLEEHLVHSGILTPEQYRRALEEFYGVPLTSEEDYPKEPVLVNSGPFKDLTGIFQKKISEKGRVRTLLSLIGVDVPV